VANAGELGHCFGGRIAVLVDLRNDGEMQHPAGLGRRRLTKRKCAALAGQESALAGRSRRIQPRCGIVSMNS
jgi:hypothetical protein